MTRPETVQLFEWHDVYDDVGVNAALVAAVAAYPAIAGVAPDAAELAFVAEALSCPLDRLCAILRMRATSGTARLQSGTTPAPAAAVSVSLAERCLTRLYLGSELDQGPPPVPAGGGRTCGTFEESHVRSGQRWSAARRPRGLVVPIPQAALLYLLARDELTTAFDVVVAPLAFGARPYSTIVDDAAARLSGIRVW